MTSQVHHTSEIYLESTQSSQSLNEEQLITVEMIEKLDSNDLAVLQIDQVADLQNIGNLFVNLETRSISDSPLNEDDSIEHGSCSSFDEDFNESELTELLIADQQNEECLAKEEEVAECLAIDQDLTRCLASDEEMLALLETSERCDEVVDFENENTDTGDVEVLEYIPENVVDLFCNQRVVPAIYDDEEKFFCMQKTNNLRARSEPDLAVSADIEVSVDANDTVRDDNDHAVILQKTCLENYDVMRDSELLTHYLHCQHLRLCEKCRLQILCVNCVAFEFQSCCSQHHQSQESLHEINSSESLSDAESFAVAQMCSECLQCANEDQERLLNNRSVGSNEPSSNRSPT